MCLIINRPEGGIIPPHYLTHASQRNPDGWGVMWASGGKVKTVRGMHANKLAKAIASAGDGPLSVHLRFATHGTKNVDNCHPFTFAAGRYAVMHNGILASIPTVDKTRSDTWHFAHHVLEPMLLAAPELFDSPRFAPMLGAMIGDGNKLVILRADGAEVIVNRHVGEDDTKTGLWLSNTYSIAPPITFSFTSKAPGAITRTSDNWAYSESKWKGSSYASWRDDELSDVPLLDETQEAVAEPSRASTDHVYDIWDCQDVERDDLIELCAAEPDMMADIIISALDDLRHMGF